MIFCKNTVNTKYYNSVTEIPKEVWQELGCTENLYFSPKYLNALEENNSQIGFRYLIVTDENLNPIAFATIAIVDFFIDSVQNKTLSIIDKVKRFVRKSGVINIEKPYKMILCGNPFVSGEHGLFIKNKEDKNEIMKQIVTSVLDFFSSEDNLKDDIYVFKDFYEDSLKITNELNGHKFYSFNVEPNMQMKIQESWITFDDYLSALRTKFRVKAKKAFTLSEDLKCIQATKENLKVFLPKMESLYKSVSNASSFNLVNFDLNTFQSLKEALGDNYVIDVYLLNDRVVGFKSALLNGGSLEAHFVGLDYELNRKLGIYQRMLYDYINLAILNRCTILNLGRTASEIKSSVGAYPQDLTIYVRHKRTRYNKILKHLLHRVKPSEFRQSKVYKEIK